MKCRDRTGKTDQDKTDRAHKQARPRPRVEEDKTALGIQRLRFLFIQPECNPFIRFRWQAVLSAHPIASFDFGPQGHLCFSIEIRPKRGQKYSTLAGLYRQFTLIYIAADERDVVRLRTNYKHEDIYLYRLRFSPDEARVRFKEYIDVLNELYARPAWYNVITHNCTTAIRALHPSAQQAPWDWRILINGFLDRMLYERGVLAGDLPFEELRAQALINKRAQEAGDAPDFSEKIRVGLAGF